MTYIKLNRSWDAVSAAIALLTAQSGAMAAPPPNDAPSRAIAISALPFKSSVDTTEATSAGDDPIYGGKGSTVWYSFTSRAGGRVLLDTLGSDYDTTLFVYTGSPGAYHQIVWDDDGGGEGGQSRLLLKAEAGVTYTVMVGGFAGEGGSLALSAAVAPPPITLGLRLDPDGSFDSRTGVATIHGKVICSDTATVGVFGDLTQAVGNSTAAGSVFTYVVCGGDVAWSTEVNSQDARFGGGQAHVTATVMGYSRATGEYVEGVGSADVQLIAR